MNRPVKTGMTDFCKSAVGRIYGSFRVFSAIVFLIPVLIAFNSVVSAQDEFPTDSAPPPLKFIPKEDIDILLAEKDIKKRTKIVLELMEVRIQFAETAASAENYKEVFDQLGVFHGLMDNTLEFLTGKEKMTGKVLNNFKRFEIGLRKFTPRLELLRRKAPYAYEFYVRSLLKQLREARTKATDPLYGNTVLSIKNK